MAKARNEEKRLKVMYAVLGVLALLFMFKTFGGGGGGEGSSSSELSTTSTTVVDVSLAPTDGATTATTVAPADGGIDFSGLEGPARNPFDPSGATD
ncbi:MAG: hypothetical protein SGJ13_03265 [Actinomycetota bacterium]|nr:hypothetical protein [Actinomycetota bacterium]